MNRAAILLFIVVLVLGTGFAQAGTVRSTITLTADRLVATQDETGFWGGETAYTGAIVAGLVCAYQTTGDDAYRTAAELGGSYIIQSAAGNYYGDEAYALSLLSEISADPDNNYWRNALSLFYESVRSDDEGTAGYLGSYSAIDPSTAVFYIAHHVRAAYYVNAVEKTLWRQALIDYLSEVADNTADYPVMAMGVATWALAQTGPLDTTPIRTPPGGQSYWSSKTLADLPGLLLGRQVPSEETYAGSFYWFFSNPHGESPDSGYAEDTIYGCLGLSAVSKVDFSVNYDVAILAAREILPLGVDSSGVVHEHIWEDGLPFHAFAGEMLQALGAFSPAGDKDDDGDVDFVDLFNFFDHWLETPCAYPDWCSGADFNFDGIVNMLDYAIFAENWQVFTGE